MWQNGVIYDGKNAIAKVLVAGTSYNEETAAAASPNRTYRDGVRRSVLNEKQHYTM